MKRYIKSNDDNFDVILLHYTLYSYYGFSLNNNDMSYDLNEVISQFDVVYDDTKKGWSNNL